MMALKLFAVLALLISSSQADSALKTISESETRPEIFITEAEKTLKETFEKCQPYTEVARYTEATLDAKIKIITELDTCGKNLEAIAKKAREYNLETIEDWTVKKALDMLINLESPLKLGSYISEINLAIQSINQGLAERNIDVFEDDQMLSLKEIEHIGLLINSDSVAELNYYWNAVADKVRAVGQEPFLEVVRVIKRVAKTYNVTATKFWYPNYSEEKMLEFEQVMKQLKPFYEQLHAYTRYKILRKHGAGVIKPAGTIPKHLYDQIQALAWGEFNKYLNDDFPFQQLPSYEQIFINSGHEPSSRVILELAENFYESLGFDNFTQDIWTKHIIKSQDHNNSCVSRVFDNLPHNVTFVYCDKNDLDAFAADHELLGRVHGALLLKQLPLFVYDGNSFGEQFGRAVKLSAITEKHLKTIGLAKGYDFSEVVKTNVNVRFAFETLLTLNYEYIHARLITDFLEGKVRRKQLNRHYWQLLEEYAGIEPPIDRHEESFDLPYQVIFKFMRNHNFIRDFENSILSFQIYKAGCDKVGHTGDLSDCDFYNSRAFGNEIQLKILQNFGLPEKKLNADALVANFRRTQEWLTEFNTKNKVTIGWTHTSKQTFKELFHSERDALLFIQQASDKIYKHFNQINEDLYLNKNKANKYEHDALGELFWKVSESAVAASDLKDISLTAKKISTSNFKDKSLKRALKNIARISDIFVLGADMAKFYRSKEELHKTATDRDVPMFGNKTELLALHPDIRNIFMHSENEEELKYYWKAWRENNSEWARALLIQMLDAFETAAKILEIPVAEFWFKFYNIKFMSKMEKAIILLRPLYYRIHHYVKTKLIEKYGPNILSQSDGAIPDHLVQQVLLQIWTPESIVEKDFPYNELPPHDQIIKERNYSALDLIRKSNEFYDSIGFEPLDNEMWFERLKPQHDSANMTDCHAIIFDTTPKTYMKYCDYRNYRKLLQAHGHVARLHYAEEKKDLPAYFFGSYFLEYPVGEAIILSASSLKHSKAINLINDFLITDKVLLNRQIRMAIHTLFNLHKYFVHTKVMLHHLEGDIKREKLGKFYWKYMVKYAGIEPPVDRDAADFDFPFEFYTDLEQNHQVKKFVSEVLGYQMYETLCNLSGHVGDLNNCDFYGSKPAGEALRKMMKLGSTVPLKVVLKSLLPDNGLNVQSLLHYYDPLEKWFEDHNVTNTKVFAQTRRIFEG